VCQTKLWILVPALLLSILLLFPAQAALSSGDPLLTTSLTASTPVQTSFNGNRAVSLNYTNTTTGPLLAIVWLSVQNSAGQTVGVFASTVTLSAGATVPVYVIIYGLAGGHYSGMVFAVTSDGVPISGASTVQISL